MDRDVLMRILVALFTLPSLLGYVLLLNKWQRTATRPSFSQENKIPSHRGRSHWAGRFEGKRAHAMMGDFPEEEADEISPLAIFPQQSFSSGNLFPGDGSGKPIDEQEIRKATIEANCRRRLVRKGAASLDNLIAARARLLQHFMVDDNHKVVYCYIPKVACTNWKRIMMILTGKSNKTDPLEISSWLPHEPGILKSLSDRREGASSVRKKLTTYTKFLFVRHPMERLVSAFRNKFEKNTTSARYFKKNFGVKILKKYRKKSPYSESGDGVTFSEFVRFILDPKVRRTDNYNEHWAPYVDMCHPCLVKYDIIGKYETLMEDSEFILRNISAPSDLHFPQLVRSKTVVLVPKYLKTLEPKLRSKLFRYYQGDFLLFEYYQQANVSNTHSPFIVTFS